MLTPFHGGDVADVHTRGGRYFSTQSKPYLNQRRHKPRRRTALSLTRVPADVKRADTHPFYPSVSNERYTIRRAVSYPICSLIYYSWECERKTDFWVRIQAGAFLAIKQVHGVQGDEQEGTDEYAAGSCSGCCIWIVGWHAPPFALIVRGSPAH